MKYTELAFSEPNGIHVAHFMELSFADVSELLSATEVVGAALGRNNLIAVEMDRRASDQLPGESDLQFGGEVARQIRRAISVVAIGSMQWPDNFSGATPEMRAKYGEVTTTARTLDVQTGTIALHEQYVPRLGLEAEHKQLLAAEHQQATS